MSTPEKHTLLSIMKFKARYRPFRASRPSKGVWQFLGVGPRGGMLGWKIGSNLVTEVDMNELTWIYEGLVGVEDNG